MLSQGLASARSLRFCSLMTGFDLALGFQPMAKVVAMLAARRLPQFIGAAVHLVIVGHSIFFGKSGFSPGDFGSGFFHIGFWLMVITKVGRQFVHYLTTI